MFGWQIIRCAFHCRSERVLIDGIAARVIALIGNLKRGKNKQSLGREIARYISVGLLIRLWRFNRSDLLHFTCSEYQSWVRARKFPSSSSSFSSLSLSSIFVSVSSVILMLGSIDYISSNPKNVFLLEHWTYWDPSQSIQASKLDISSKKRNILEKKVHLTPGSIDCIFSDSNFQPNLTIIFS